MDALSSLPRDTAYVRNILFTLPLPFSLSLANYQLYWPLIDNVYSIRRSRDRHDSESVTKYVICRFGRVRDPKLPSSSQGFRSATTKRASASCNVSYVIQIFANHVTFDVHKRSITCHDHTLDESDANKRNSYLMGILQADIVKGFAPAAIIGSLRGNGRADFRARFNAAGGEYLTRQDAINAGRTRRLANPNVLFVSSDTTKDNKSEISRSEESKLKTIEVLDRIRARFVEIAEYGKTLEPDARDRLFSRWEGELAKFSSSLIGSSLMEWLKRDTDVNWLA